MLNQILLWFDFRVAVRFSCFEHAFWLTFSWAIHNYRFSSHTTSIKFRKIFITNSYRLHWFHRHEMFFIILWWFSFFLFNFYLNHTWLLNGNVIKRNKQHQLNQKHWKLILKKIKKKNEHENIIIPERQDFNGRLHEKHQTILLSFGQLSLVFLVFTFVLIMF